MKRGDIMSEVLVLVLFFVQVILPVLLCIVGIYLVFLLMKALKLYIQSQEGKPEYSTIRASLGETLKAHRERCGMTQEVVANALSVSRQAVSKWETGKSDPNTSNLLTLAKLYNISIEELLRNVHL